MKFKINYQVTSSKVLLFVIQSFYKLFQKDKVQNLQTSDEPQNQLPGHMFQKNIVHLPPKKQTNQDLIYTQDTPN